MPRADQTHVFLSYSQPRPQKETLVESEQFPNRSDCTLCVLSITLEGRSRFALCACSLDAVPPGEPCSNRFIEELQEEPRNKNRERKYNEYPGDDLPCAWMPGPCITGKD